MQELTVLERACQHDKGFSKSNAKVTLHMYLKMREIGYFLKLSFSLFVSLSLSLFLSNVLSNGRYKAKIPIHYSEMSTPSTNKLISSQVVAYAKSKVKPSVKENEGFCVG